MGDILEFPTVKPKPNPRPSQQPYVETLIGLAALFRASMIARHVDKDEETALELFALAFSAFSKGDIAAKVPSETVESRPDLFALGMDSQAKQKLELLNELVVDAAYPGL